MTIENNLSRQISAFLINCTIILTCASSPPPQVIRNMNIFFVDDMLHFTNFNLCYLRPFIGVFSKR